MSRSNVPRGRTVIDLTDDHVAEGGGHAPENAVTATEGTFGAECPICFEPAENAHATPCGHVFCGNCAQQCALRSNACPLCRTDGAFFPLPPPPPQMPVEVHQTHRTYDFPSGRVLEEWSDVSVVRVPIEIPDARPHSNRLAATMETWEMRV